MDTNINLLSSTVPTPFHPYWATQENAGSQPVPSTQFYRPQTYPQQSVNLTDLPQKGHEGPDPELLDGQILQRMMSFPFSLRTKC